ncbi:MAG: shufflon system plasmid conjugative transfer pilus tip adhesin PilV, partial [Alphaproteobacteria bacterium]|nr:shufflon system plasmid conjugative transfer pilus tip adhesin PilV [Alphaproteobacteria bacterium]
MACALMDRKRWFAIIVVAALVVFWPLCSNAQEKTTPGGACTTGQSAADWDTVFQCDSSIWKRAAVRIGSSSASCDGTKAGMIQWTGTSFTGCDGASWSGLGGGALGASATNTSPARADDITTGLFSSTASTVSVATAGVSRLTVTASGYVGIGTTNPTNNLQIGSVSDTGHGLAVASPIYGAIIKTNDSSTAGALRVVTNMSGTPVEAFRVQNNGNVGIGTVSPGYGLSVFSGGNVNGVQAQFGSNTFLSNYSSGAYLSNATFNSSGTWTARSTGATAIGMVADGIHFYADSGLTSGNTFSPTQRMLLDTSGNFSVNGSVLTSSAAVYHYSNVFSYEVGGSTQTGTVKISLPKYGSATMLHIVLKGYDYSTYGAWQVTIGGYNYSADHNWYSTSVHFNGRVPFTQVRLGNDGVHDVILLGTTSSTWSYGKIEVADVLTMYSNHAGWGSGWSGALLTSESGLANIVTLTPDIYVNSSGYVGIGTTAPAYMLNVAGDAGVGASYHLISRYNNSEAYKASLGWNSIQFGNNGTNYIIGGRTSAGGALTFVTNNTADYRYGVTNHNGTEAMTITSGGYVGIGVSPGYKLHVAGDIYANGGWLRTSGGAGWYSESYGGGWYMEDTSWIRGYNNKNLWMGPGLLGTNGGVTSGYG